MLVRLSAESPEESARDPARRLKIEHSRFPNMRAVPGGLAILEAGPVTQRIEISPFWMDATPVTNRMFAHFVLQTGYVTLAETPLDPDAYPNVPEALLRAGSTVFAPGRERADLQDWSNWWAFRFGACWRRPYGINSSIAGLEEHPVVHIAFEDALAFAKWSGKELPSETEWEMAAWGGTRGDSAYPWGDELAPRDRHMSNTWQGAFPYENLRSDGYARTSPVHAFPANAYDLCDLLGNVWEWTTTVPASLDVARGAGCGISTPLAGLERCGRRTIGTDCNRFRVIKGGSFLCAPSSCGDIARNARRAHLMNAPACHIGFRCVMRV